MQLSDFFTYVRDFDHSLGVYLTFTLDTQVIEKIRENSGGRTVILHDIRHGVTIKPEWENRVLCFPVPIPVKFADNCFHAKLALLKGPRNIRLIVGSLNLSRSAFQRYKEICFSVDLPISSDVAQEVLRFLRSFPVGHSLWQDLMSEFDAQDRVSSQRNRELLFVHNSDLVSIADQVLSALKENRFKGVPVLHVGSPFLSQKYGEPFAKFFESIAPRETHLYLRPGQPLGLSIKGLPGLLLHDPKGKKRESFHAKLIVLEYENGVIAFVGSANFTNQGFFLNLSSGGNYENGVIIRSSVKQIVMDWFTHGWSSGKPASLWTENPDLSGDREEEPANIYAMAERTRVDQVRINLFLPRHDLIQRVTVDNVRRGWNYDSTLQAYEAEISFKGDVLNIQIPGHKALRVPVFDAMAFQHYRLIDGDGLFLHSKAIESINEVSLSSAIREQGIRVGRGGTQIVEPPLLEQFFRNAKEQLTAVRRKNVPSKAYLDDLKNCIYEIGEIVIGKERFSLTRSGEMYYVSKSDIGSAAGVPNHLVARFKSINEIAGLNLSNSHLKTISELFERRGLHGATAFYLLLHLYAIFHKKRWQEFSDVCSNRISQMCLESIDLPAQKLLKYSENWLL